MPPEPRKEDDGSERRLKQPILPPGTEAAGQTIGGKGSVPEWIAELDKILDSPPAEG